MSKINSNGYLMDCVDNDKEVSDETLMAYAKKEMATEQYHRDHIKREAEGTIFSDMEDILILLAQRKGGLK